jgi:Zn ribbon nucleic-acid-binding protein
MNCPRCDSDKIAIISQNYPKTYECKKCGHIFMQLPKALLDE